MRSRSLRLLSSVFLLAGCGRSEADLLFAGPDAAPACAGHAGVFNGAAYLAIDRPVQDDFTLEAWIKTTDSPSGSAFYHGSGLMYADAAPGTNPLGANDFGASVLNNRFAFGVGNPDTTLTSGGEITSGQWVHVAATRRMATGQIRVLVNGALEASVATTQQGSLIDQPMMRFGNTTLDDRYFTGVMDEIRIWNVVRTPGEIRDTMHRLLAGDEAGLVLYLQFDDAGGTTQVDSSSAGAEASVVGPLEWAPSDAPVCEGDPALRVSGSRRSTQ